MGTKSKIALILAGLIVAATIGYVVYLMASSGIANDFEAHLELSLMVGDGTSGVMLETADGDKRLSTEDVRTLRFYLDINSVATLRTGDRSIEPVVLRIEDDVIKLYRVKDDPGKGIVYFDTQGKHFHMCVQWDDFWKNIDALTAKYE